MELPVLLALNTAAVASVWRAEQSCDPFPVKAGGADVATDSLARPANLKVSSAFLARSSEQNLCLQQQGSIPLVRI